MARFRNLKDESDPFSFVPINTAGKMLCKEIAVVMNSGGTYELFYKKDMEAYKKIAELDRLEKEKSMSDALPPPMIEARRLDSYANAEIFIGPDSSRKSNYVYVEEH